MHDVRDEGLECHGIAKDRQEIHKIDPLTSRTDKAVRARKIRGTRGLPTCLGKSRTVSSLFRMSSMSPIKACSGGRRRVLQHVARTSWLSSELNFLHHI